MQPLVSILIPAYNSRRWIKDSIESALNQSWQRKEVVVVDDGSTDGTPDVARRYRSARVKVVTQGNRGASVARNRLLGLAQGDYIQWLDSDDLLHPQKISHQLKAAALLSDNVLLSSRFARFYYRTEKSTFTPNALWQDLQPVEWFVRKYANGHFMLPSAWLVSRKLTEAAGGWDERLTLDDDGEYFSRVVAACDAIKFVPESICYYRQANPKSISKTINREACRSLLLSYKLAIARLLALEDSDRTRSCALRHLQANLIHFYPEHAELLQEIYEFARELGGSLSPPDFSAKYFLLNKVFGLGITKRVASRVRTFKYTFISKSDELMWCLERKNDYASRGQSMLLKSLSARKRELHHLPKAIFSRYYCDRPRQVDIELSNRCNLQCGMCWFHGEGGLGDRYHGDELTTPEVFDLVEQLAALNPQLQIYLGGAEPYVREDFGVILRHIKSLQLSVSFTTNGTLLDPERLKELVAIGADCINFSIDGGEDLHDRQRGAGVFRTVTENVKALSTLKLEAGSVKPLIGVNITVSGELAGRLPETLESIKEATNDGADYYRIHHQWYVSQDELDAHQSTVSDKLGCRAGGAAAHLLEGVSIPDPFLLADDIDSLRSQPKVITFPDLGREDVIDYYADNPTLANRCIAPLVGAVIKPNGDVVFCPDAWIDDYVLGNIRQQRFEEIWNNERARKFREVLIKERRFQGCNRCSWMYAY